MKVIRFIVFAAGLAGALVSVLRQHRAQQQRWADARARSSIDDVPVIQPAQPYQPGQAPQPQDLRIVQNVLE